MNISLNKKLKSFITENIRYKVVYGGRGSGKSWNIARMLLLKVASSVEPLRILCTREIQDSIKDSVYKLLKDQIELMELPNFITQNDIIKHVNGSEFLFKGLYTNLSKIKSFEGVDICWIEEAESISAMSWLILDPTIRKPNSEIWISFNPSSENDIIYQTFILNKPDNAVVIKLNYQDNKYFPEVLREQKDRMRANDPDLYMHIWEGELRKNTNELVFNNKWLIDDFDIPGNTHFYFGADWGFANDPNTVIKCFVDSHSVYGSRCLYICDELCDRPYDDERETSTDISELPKLWDNIKDIKKFSVICDSARPETISYMRRAGFRAEPAKKGKGSIEDGIEFIRGFDKIIVSPKCKNSIFEFGNYKFKTDKNSGQITNQIIDKYNHCIDALRYALEPLMLQKRKIAFFGVR
ncbi:phage terminase%2C large subunit%2C PBSX family [Campylobacter hyointestinalis subsp. hyointestinalis]|uniref:Phage terminase, large subunit, PBSX family n=1 Tax=Campylobacter hyointestinalis subsp. hyointestinalis TaxID=91352 RepID=A0A9W5ALP0_CAMHY|nr:PBSX family phage terminase large subunit [Campylobacter hyointestinalis]CUU67921.1 phage terminase%2C large subunit%2C PBSX family [Campylobacter hyointestinalis subsp. hyointestinalis]